MCRQCKLDVVYKFVGYAVFLLRVLLLNYIGNEMFLSKIRLNITGSADNRWRFPIIHLAIEDNLLKNNSNVFRFYHRIIYIQTL